MTLPLLAAVATTLFFFVKQSKRLIICYDCLIFFYYFNLQMQKLIYFCIHSITLNFYNHNKDKEHFLMLNFDILQIEIIFSKSLTKTKMKTILLIIALILVSKATQTTQCPQNNQLDLLQTGIIQFFNTNQRQSCQTVELKYKVGNGQLQVAASVVSTENYHVLNGIDYAVKVGPQPGNNRFVATLLSDSNANWTKITVSYLATSRPDLLLGSFLTDSFQTLKCIEDQTSQSNVLQVSHVVKDWNKQFLLAKPIVFMSGIKTISSNVNSLKIGKLDLNSSGILNVEIQSNHGLQLQLIQLSYILVSSAFPHQHGFQINHPEYGFPVFEEFTNNNLVQVRWGIYTGSLICEGALCEKVCVNKDQCAKSNGNEKNGHCYICDKGKAWDGDECISLCGDNEFWSGDSCVCNSNAIRVKSSCVVCGPNSTPDKTQRQCVCNPGYIWNNWKSSCLSYSCPTNSQPTCTQTGVQCVCKLGFYKVNDTCKQIPDCPTNSVFNIIDKRCVCTIQGQFMGNGVCISCNKNQQFDDISKKCVCKSNFLLIGTNCVACPAFSTLNSDKSKCICNDGYIWNDWKVACVPFKCPLNSIPVASESGVNCNCKDGFYANGQTCDLIPKCPYGTVFDIKVKNCVCQKPNTYLINGKCVQCPLNSAWNGNQCVCNTGYLDLNGICTFICGKNQVLQSGKCICNPKSILINKVCQQCPLNSSPNKQKTLCNCNQGHKWDDSKNCCSKVVCPENSMLQVINNVPTCVCNDGFVMQNSLCVRVGRCPVNSAWSQEKLCCVCVNPGEFMINNECRKCGANQEWNEREKKCMCKAGLNLIGNECKACEVGEFFNGVTCECNLGSYRNGAKCDPCHPTCGTCSGPNSNQCLTCSDVTFSFKNGCCSRDSTCPKGLYQKGAACSPCSTYCADCISESTCNSCIDGFQLESITYGGVTASYCVEKCGDGKRFELDCDDGNNRNGDGCSADCKVEAGWTCSGGSSTKPSFCTQGMPERTYLQLTGTVHLYGRIVQGVRLSYIPETLSANDCPECYNLLWVRVIKSDIIPGVRVNYLPKSKYQFLVEFQFHGTFSIPVFNIAVQINPEYAKYFNRKDMAQIQIKTIDPSVLAMKDKQQQLSLDEVNTGKAIKIPNTLVKEIFN